eukprot:7384737-Prymnesium_polylepis.3
MSISRSIRASGNTIRSQQHPHAPHVADASLMNRRSAAYGDHRGDLSDVRALCVDKRIAGRPPRTKGVVVPYIDERFGGGVPKVAFTYMKAFSYGASTLQQFGRAAFRAADATGEAVEAHLLSSTASDEELARYEAELAHAEDMRFQAVLNTIVEDDAGAYPEEHDD